MSAAATAEAAVNRSIFNRPIIRKWNRQSWNSDGSGTATTLSLPISTLPGRRWMCRLTAAASGDTGTTGGHNNTRKKMRAMKEDGKYEAEQQREGEEEVEQSSNSRWIMRLDDVNPVGLGRRSRQIFDEIWGKFSGLGQISRTNRPDGQGIFQELLIREGPMCEFTVPGAQNTTVLVVGDTSVGRVLVRKLMLRGYSVKGLQQQTGTSTSRKKQQKQAIIIQV